MAVFNLTYATTRALIKVLRKSLASDPLFQPDKTGPSRSAESMVLDAWGYQVRDFPVVVVTGVPGASRRMGFNDQVRPFFGVPLTEEPGGTATLRTFDVPLAVVVGSTLDVRYTGDNADLMNPPSPWQLEVKQKLVLGDPVNYAELVGSVIGPAATFPLDKFEASTKKHATGQVYGGYYDMTIEVTAVARSTQTRELLVDRLWSLIWFLKKRELRKLGVVVLDVRNAGFAQVAYGADQLYQARLSISVATEFEAIVQFAETVTDVTVVGTAVPTP